MKCQYSKNSFRPWESTLLVSIFLVISFILGNVANAGSCELGEFTREVFPNPNLRGAPVEKYCQPPGFSKKIDENWKLSGPSVGGGGGGKAESFHEPAYKVVSDNFSVRWAGTFDFAGGRYQVTTTSDDGIRVWIDKKLIMDDWNVHAPKTHRKNLHVPSGEREVRVEYFERGGGALVQVDWEHIR